VEKEYFSAVAKFGTEFNILLQASAQDLQRGLSSRIAEGVLHMREGRVSRLAGYDGEYGVISVFGQDDKPKDSEQQLSLF
jgi:PHP family Zn ribbon phosphoesterase